MFQYLRIVQDVDYNRNQSKKIWSTIFSLKRQYIYGSKNSVGHERIF